MLFIYFQGKIKCSHCIWSICLFWIFFFDLVPAFYFLNWNLYFSAYENLPNSSCHFSKYKSVFLHILHQSSLLSNITPLQFFSSSNLCFAQKEPIKVKIFDTFILFCTFLVQTIYALLKRSSLKWKSLRLMGAQVKICQVPHVSLETTVRFLSKFCIVHER